MKTRRALCDSRYKTRRILVSLEMTTPGAIPHTRVSVDVYTVLETFLGKVGSIYPVPCRHSTTSIQNRQFNPSIHRDACVYQYSYVLSVQQHRSGAWASN